MTDEKVHIVDVFLERGFLTSCAADLLRRFTQKWGGSGFEAMLEAHVFSEHTLANLCGEAFGVDRVFSIPSLEVSQDALTTLDFRVAKEIVCLPIGPSEMSPGALEVILADPSQVSQIDRLKSLIGREIALAVGERSDIVKAICEHYPLVEQIPSLRKAQKAIQY